MGFCDTSFGTKRSRSITAASLRRIGRRINENILEHKEIKRHTITAFGSNSNPNKKRISNELIANKFNNTNNTNNENYNTVEKMDSSLYCFSVNGEFLSNKSSETAFMVDPKIVTDISFNDYLVRLFIL